MSTYRLDHFFEPRSIALVGASARPTSVGAATIRNLRDGGFAGPIHVINRKYPEIEGIRTVDGFKDIPSPPDLTIICTPPSAVPGVVERAAAHGCPAAMVLTAGLGQGAGSFSDAVAKTARKTGLRLLGPT